MNLLSTVALVGRTFNKMMPTPTFPSTNAAVLTEVDGVDYEVFTVTSNFTDVENLLSSQPWFSDATGQTALKFLKALGSAWGYNPGPYFVYDDPSAAATGRAYFVFGATPTSATPRSIYFSTTETRGVWAVAKPLKAKVSSAIDMDGVSTANSAKMLDKILSLNVDTAPTVKQYEYLRRP